MRASGPSLLPRAPGLSLLQRFLPQAAVRPTTETLQPILTAAATASAFEAHSRCRRGGAGGSRAGRLARSFLGLSRACCPDSRRQPEAPDFIGARLRLCVGGVCLGRRGCKTPGLRVPGGHLTSTGGRPASTGRELGAGGGLPAAGQPRLSHGFRATCIGLPRCLTESRDGYTSPTPAGRWAGRGGGGPPHHVV
jgi:hypothetical protein